MSSLCGQPKVDPASRGHSQVDRGKELGALASVGRVLPAGIARTRRHRKGQERTRQKVEAEAAPRRGIPEASQHRHVEVVGLPSPLLQVPVREGSAHQRPLARIPDAKPDPDPASCRESGRRAHRDAPKSVKFLLAVGETRVLPPCRVDPAPQRDRPLRGGGRGRREERRNRQDEEREPIHDIRRSAQRGCIAARMPGGFCPRAVRPVPPARQEPGAPRRTKPGA